MAEVLKENFILLSKIAKEKKYAQEYLSLLARRGDLGSIRIGKRWYTTEKWMNDFIELSEKKKAMAREVAPEAVIAPPEREIRKAVLVEKIEKPQAAASGLEEWMKNVKTQPAEVVKCKIKSSFSEQTVKISPAVRERVEVQQPQSIGIKVDLADKGIICEPQAAKPETILKNTEDVRVRLERPVQPRVFSSSMDQPQRIGIQHHHYSRPPKRVVSAPRPAYIQRPVPIQITPAQNPLRQNQTKAAEEKVFYFKREAAFSSPNLSAVEEDVPAFSFFPRLAFSMATMLIFFLIISASLLYRENLQALVSGGKVAGVSTQKTEADGVKNIAESFNDDLRDLKSATSYYLANFTDKSIESVSFSQVVLKVLQEKEDLSQ